MSETRTKTKDPNRISPRQDKQLSPEHAPMAQV